MEDQVPANRLYVGNLPWSTDVDELRAIFSSCGAITHVDIPKGRQGRSRGYGIVEYSSAAEAQAAIAQLEGARPPRFSFPYSFARIGVSASAWGSRARERERDPRAANSRGTTPMHRSNYRTTRSRLFLLLYTGSHTTPFAR